MNEVQLFELLELWNVRMPDRGASHAIIHHHNGAATGAGTGGVLTGGKLEQLEIKSGGGYEANTPRDEVMQERPEALNISVICIICIFPDPNCVPKEEAPLHPATLRYDHHFMTRLPILLLLLHCFLSQLSQAFF